MKKNIKNIISVFLCLILSLIICYLVKNGGSIIIECTKLPSVNSLTIPLNWLPEKYPRNPDKFEIIIENRKIKYSTESANEAAISKITITSQFKIPKNYTRTYKIAIWYLKNEKIIIILKKSWYKLFFLAYPVLGLMLLLPMFAEYSIINFKKLVCK